MKTLITLIATCLFTAAAVATDIQANPIFQMRLVADRPSATSESMTETIKSNDGTIINILNIEKAVLIDQSALKSARVTKDSFGHPVIELAFTKKGAEQFAAVTQTNLHKRLAIVIDGHLNSAPMIQSPIKSGKVEINGDFSKEEATDLANRINAFAKK